MSFEFIALCPETAVICAVYHAHPSARKKPERMDGAQLDWIQPDWYIPKGHSSMGAQPEMKSPAEEIPRPGAFFSDCF
jgi:hypothetical protein